MTDCIPADAVRELRDELRGDHALESVMESYANETNWGVSKAAGAVADLLDSLIAQARPCDEGLLRRILAWTDMGGSGLDAIRDAVRERLADA